MNQNNEKILIVCLCISIFMGGLTAFLNLALWNVDSPEHNMQENGTRMGKLCLLYEYATWLTLHLRCWQTCKGRLIYRYLELNLTRNLTLSSTFGKWAGV